MKFLIKLFLIFLLFQPIKANNITLSWTAPTDPDIVSFNLYCGNINNGPYNNEPLSTFDTNITLSLSAPNTYYFVVTAVDKLGLESPFSNQASFILEEKTITPIINRISGGIDDGKLLISATGPIGANGIVEVSEDLISWRFFTSILNCDGAIDFIDDTITSAITQRFYRVYFTFNN